MIRLCNNIKIHRELSGKSQTELADELGAKRTTYQNWEVNTEPDLATIQRIADILGIHVSRLLEGVLRLDNRPAPDETDVSVSVTMKRSDLENLAFNLNALGSTFSSAAQKGISKPVGDLALGSKKPRQSLPKKDKQKDIS